MAVEMLLQRKQADGSLVAGASLGVPMIDIWSDDPNGQAVSNNIRWWGGHMETSPEGGVPLMAHGANTGSQTFIGWKIECTETPTPMIVLDSVHGFYYQGWLWAGASGAPFEDVGSVPNGTTWALAYPNRPGALLLAADSYNPRIIGNGGHANGGNAGQAESLFYFKRCTNPQVEFGVEDGLNRMTRSRITVDACDRVSPYALRAPAAPYVPGSDLVTLANLNNSTLDATLQAVTIGGKQYAAALWG